MIQKYFLNGLWQQAEVPEEWNGVNITPTFKNGSEEDLENYRPFSITSISREVTDTCSWKLFPDMSDKKVTGNSSMVL